MFHRDIVEHIAGLGIVRSIKDKVASDDFFSIARVEIEHHRLDRHVTIDRAQPIGGRDCFGETLPRIGFIEEHLPLQIRQLDDIAIDDPQVSQPGPYELIGQGAPQRAAPDQHGTRVCQGILRRSADLREQNLSLISVHLRN
jgi:hypothetical protein